MAVLYNFRCEACDKLIKSFNVLDEFHENCPKQEKGKRKPYLKIKKPEDIEIV